MKRTDYENNVAMICDLLKPNFKVITKQKICLVYNIMTERPNVPSFWLTDAMKKWGKSNNYEIVYSVSKRNRVKNVMLVQA